MAKATNMRLVLFFPLVCALGCGDDSSSSGGAGGNAGSGGGGGIDAAAGTGGADAPIDAPDLDAPGRGDANLSDAGANTTPITPGVVDCTVSAGSCSTPTNACCGTGTAGSLTFACTPASSCTGIWNASCDGTEDCAGGEVCCGSRPGSMGFLSVCSATCMANERQVCHDHTQCPSTEPSCCTGANLGARAPFGFCFTPGREPPNSRCDTP